MFDRGGLHPPAVSLHRYPCSERKGGELLAGSGIGKGVKSVTLSDFGLNEGQSSRWQSLASIPEPDFDAYIAEAYNDGRELTTAGALKRELADG
jgi:hypothetical protein